MTGSLVRGGIGYLFIVTPSAALPAASFAAGLQRQSEVSVVLVHRHVPRARWKSLGGSLVRRSTGGSGGREGRRKGLARTVPRNHELMTPGHVSPFSSTLIPPVKTTVLAAAAGAKPGLGSTRNAEISSTNGGSARAPASDRRVRRRGQISARSAPLLGVPTRRAGTAESTRFPPADDTAGVGRRHRAVVPGTEIVVIERPPRCAANARRATVAARGKHTHHKGKLCRPDLPPMAQITRRRFVVSEWREGQEESTFFAGLVLFLVNEPPNRSSTMNCAPRVDLSSVAGFGSIPRGGTK